jgi:stearoyl-CoA desaturase (delta-9 desaturase)
MLKNLNLISAFALIGLPLLLITLLFHYLHLYDFTARELALILLGYYGANIAVGIGLHRLWSHDSYKTNKFVEFILALLSAGTLQGPVLSWASNHFKHHSYTDSPQDPHSPLRYDNKLKGFFWAHMGWMLTGEGSYKSVDKVTMVKLGRNKILRWQLKNYWLLAVMMNTLVPALLGLAFFSGTKGLFAGIVFVGLGRALQQQMTFCVNSLCHVIGSQPYVNGTSRDIWWMAIFLLGENWHNFHHAFPSDYRNGTKWYHFDVHKWIIFLMSKIGLAWDLKITAPVRIEQKQNQKQQATVTVYRTLLQEKYTQLVAVIEKSREKIALIEKISSEPQAHLLATLTMSQSKLYKMQHNMQNYLQNFDYKKIMLVKKLQKHVDKLEKSTLKLLAQIEASLVI